MKTFSRGFTLIEVMVVIAIIGIIAAVAIPVLSGSMGVRTDADASMRAHIATLFPGAEGVVATCAARDTDGDGYVRCTATFVGGGSAQRQMIEAECAGGMFSFGNSGCVPIRQVGRWGY